MAYVMDVETFVKKIESVATDYKTMYIKGCFGAPMNAANKKRYTTNLTYNKNRAWIIEDATSDTFGFDCCNLIKSVFWGWTGDKYKTYGGAKYLSNGVPDTNADGMIALCNNVSSNFANIEKGEVVWMAGHIGVYVGNGKVVECTPKWNNNVQYSNLANIGYKDGHTRTWTKHGKLPWVDYSSNKVVAPVVEVWHTVVKGDTLSKIGKQYNVKWQDIASKNGIKFPYIIRVGQRIKIK